MIFKAVGWFLRDGYWIIEGGKKMNHSSKWRVTNVK
jgi:hypothetical protein